MIQEKYPTPRTDCNRNITPVALPTDWMRCPERRAVFQRMKCAKMDRTNKKVPSGSKKSWKQRRTAECRKSRTRQAHHAHSMRKSSTLVHHLCLLRVSTLLFFTRAKHESSFFPDSFVTTCFSNSTNHQGLHVSSTRKQRKVALNVGIIEMRNMCASGANASITDPSRPSLRAERRAGPVGAPRTESGGRRVGCNSYYVHQGRIPGGARGRHTRFGAHCDQN